MNNFIKTAKHIEFMIEEATTLKKEAKEILENAKVEQIILGEN